MQVPLADGTDGCRRRGTDADLDVTGGRRRRPRFAPLFSTAGAHLGVRPADRTGMTNPAAGDPAGAPDDAVVVAMMRRVCVTMFVFGGLVCLSGVWMTQSTPAAKLAQGVIAGVFVASGVACGAVRPGRRLFEASVQWSILLLGVLIALSEPIGMAPVFYLWPVVYAAYFSSVRVLALTYTWMVVSLGAGLLLNGTATLKLDTFTGATATVGLMAALVAVMTRREAGLRAELAVAAETDPLTGLLNRRSFNPLLERLVADATARHRPLSLVMFDLDHFKRLNDDHGHLVGDRALQEVAGILQEQSRGADLVSRFGGEEFAVALPGAGAADARAYTERVAAALRTMSATTELAVSVSAGISSLTAEGETVETLLTRADGALYAAKAAGRCRQACWDDRIEVGPAFGEPTAV